jgi:hypothetical protein
MDISHNQGSVSWEKIEKKRKKGQFIKKTMKTGNHSLKKAESKTAKSGTNKDFNETKMLLTKSQALKWRVQ